jgi:tetratricopeptide (TPR) repeat protein
MRVRNNSKYTALNVGKDGLICLFVIIATFSVYLQVKNHSFVGFDDNKYVRENTYVQNGLTSEGISWAFTATFASNWHPLTWLSHMMDCQLYGLKPGMHHLTNLLFHMANSLLLFFTLRRMTGNSWRSGFVAALFALHPLHVESVAWLSERKDVLSGLFWMLTLWGYGWYVERPGLKRYMTALVFFCLGLMAKPMLVTLPFVLLLLDYWPLRRFQFGIGGGDGNSKNHGALDSNHQRSTAFRLVWEKVPFFVIAAVSSILTFVVQQKGGAVRSLDMLTLGDRISNALVSYVSYIGKTVWPWNLAFFYPYPGILPMWQVAGALLLITLVFLAVIMAAPQYPYLAVGWLWYIGTLIPVIGLVQIGAQALADRYTYIPLIGIFIIIAWGVPELVARWRYRATGLAATAGALISILTAVTWLQVRYWANTITLFEHAIDVTADNYVAQNNLGVALLAEGRIAEAMKHYSEALEIKPDFERAHYNLGRALGALGKSEEAIRHYSEAVRVSPDFARAHYQLGMALAATDRTAEAIKHYSEALRLRPDSLVVHNDLGVALFREGNINESIAHFQEALRIMPEYADARNNLKMALEAKAKIPEAVEKFKDSLKVNQDPALHYKLGNMYQKNGKLNEAIEQYQKALSIQPGFTQALKDLAAVYAIKMEYGKAVSTFEKVTNLRPEDAGAYYNIACIYARQNRTEESLDWLEKAIDRGYKDWDVIKTDQNLKNIRATSRYEALIRGH